MPNSNDIILNDILEQSQSKRAPDSTPQHFFNIFTAEQALKNFGLSFEEIEDGIVDGFNDGGIDSIYTIVNGELVNEEISFEVPKKSAEIEVFIIQNKSANGFSETPIDKLISSTRNLFDLAVDHNNYPQYSAELKLRVDIFRKTTRKLASLFPSTKINYIYVAKKSSDQIHPNLILKADELKKIVNEIIVAAEVSVSFWRSEDLIKLARERPKQTFQLKFDQSLNGEKGYITLVKLSEFYNFLLNGEDSIRSDLFDSNVRDYQGTTEVNEEISNTLNTNKSDDFWWFNNGITILASRASSSGHIITIENPQIVNGLQTSSQINLYFKNNDIENDNRTLMVKIVESNNEEVRDRIIKATNNQNKIPHSSLRATDKVQRDIEHMLKINDLFYDRRKNQFKNEGKPVSKIISISQLAQAVMTLFRGEPDNARARPSTLIKEDNVYKTLFSDEFDIESYVVAAVCMKKIDAQFKATTDLTPRDRSNIRFYVLYFLVTKKAKSTDLTPEKISNLKGKIEDTDISNAIEEVKNLFFLEGGTDQLAKGTEFKIKVKDYVNNLIRNTCSDDSEVV